MPRRNPKLPPPPITLTTNDLAHAYALAAYTSASVPAIITAAIQVLYLIVQPPPRETRTVLIAPTGPLAAPIAKILADLTRAKKRA